MSPRLRAMRMTDVPGVVGIEQASFPTPWSASLFRGEIERCEGRRWLVIDDGEVLGYAGMMEVGEEAHVLNLAVHPSYRRRGYAAALLGELMRLAAEDGVRRMTLEVRPSNTAAVALYERAGFHVAGVRPGYYDDTNEDALIMWTGPLDQDPYPEIIACMTGAGRRALSGEADGDFMPEAPPAPMAAPQRDDLILAIETSCDETAAAVMRNGRELLSSVVATQVDFHARFGGVVPEIASRKHTEAVVGVVDQALEVAGVTFGDLTALAVTHGPGLVGALVVGLAYAKGLALATGLPLVGVNHLEGHIFANVLADETVAPPLVALVVSGGHTSLVHMPEWGVYRTLGSTLDDAAGEAFDKVAKVLGLGYPGGPVLAKLAEEGDPTAIRFPRAMINTPDYDFSLSGLKTAVITYIRAQQAADNEIVVADLAASFQAAVIDVQVAKSVRAAREHGVRTFCLAGGVAANEALRERLRAALAEHGIRLSVPPFAFCTDNAAMIAAAAHYRLLRGETLDLAADAIPNLRLDT